VVDSKGEVVANIEPPNSHPFEVVNVAREFVCACDDQEVAEALMKKLAFYDQMEELARDIQRKHGQIPTLSMEKLASLLREALTFEDGEKSDDDWRDPL
jgi:hypothetical protein